MDKKIKLIVYIKKVGKFSLCVSAIHSLIQQLFAEDLISGNLSHKPEGRIANQTDTIFPFTDLQIGIKGRN